jgi:hypothetical protein
MCNRRPAAGPEIAAVLSAPDVRFFAKAILGASLKYDPVDALDDVELAAATLRRRLERMQAEEMDRETTHRR